MNNTTVTTVQQNITVTSNNETVTIVDGSATNVTVAQSPAAHIGNGFHYRPVVTNINGYPTAPFNDDDFWAGGDSKALAWNPDYDASQILDLQFAAQGGTIPNSGHHASGQPLGNAKKIVLWYRNPRLESSLFFNQTGPLVIDCNESSSRSGVKYMVSEKGGLRSKQRSYGDAFTAEAKEAQKTIGNEFDNPHVIETCVSLNTAHIELAINNLASSGIDGGTF